MEWHDYTCKKLDLAIIGGLQSCMRCGSFDKFLMAASPPSSNAAVYTPIRQQLDIRVLTLKPGGFHEPLECELSVVELSAEHDFDAISYTWADESGNEDFCKSISIGGQRFAVTPNCEMVLRRVRYEENTRDVWIDAICIDQSNNEERSNQVRLMSRIFYGAFRVLAYLGEAADDSNSLLRAIDRGETYTNYATADHLLSRRYFKRLWIVQEVALARRITLLCGDKVVPWTEFVTWCRKHLMPQTVLPPVIMFDRRHYTEPDQVLATLELAVSCEAARKHDKIYALLGLLPPAMAHGLVVDYNLTVEQLYGQVAIYAAEMSGWAPLMATAARLGRSLPTLPSWIPDWSDQPKGPKLHESCAQEWRFLLGNRPNKIPSMQNAYKCALAFTEAKINRSPIPWPFIGPYARVCKLDNELPNKPGNEYIRIRHEGPLYTFLEPVLNQLEIRRQLTQLITVRVTPSPKGAYTLDEVAPTDGSRTLVLISSSLMLKLLPLVVAKYSWKQLRHSLLREYYYEGGTVDVVLDRMTFLKQMALYMTPPLEVTPEAPATSLVPSFGKSDNRPFTKWSRK